MKDFSVIATPLYKLTGKENPFRWNDNCQKAFDRLKEVLQETPVLKYPNPELPYILDCDASEDGIGAVLSQKIEGKERVVAYYSYKFNQPERNYSVTKKELLAVVKGVNNFHPYLYGSQFLIRTDHAALTWLKTLKNPEGQLARWLGKLEEYDYQI